jgi:hypothetical protein
MNKQAGAGDLPDSFYVSTGYPRPAEEIFGLLDEVYARYKWESAHRVEGDRGSI